MIGFIGRPFTNGLTINEVALKAQRSQGKYTVSYQVQFCRFQPENDEVEWGVDQTEVNLPRGLR